MVRPELTESLLRALGVHFRALSEPARLRLLDALRRRERTVNDLVEATGLSQANTSKHLHHLHTLGYVRRRKAGLFVWYALADRSVLKMFDQMAACIDPESDVPSLRQR
jgi:DNA-binding transcriptional ArsR family regulator